MTDNNTRIIDLTQLVRDETEKARKSARNTWIAGLVIVLLVGGYFSFITYMVKEILTPVLAARMIAMHVEANWPVILDEAERSIADKAPELANTVVDKAMESMPVLRKMAEKQIDITYEDMLPLLREEIRSSIRTFMDLNGAHITELYEAQKEEGFADEFVDALTAQMVESIDSDLELYGKDKSLDYVSVASLDTLQDINDELIRLAGMKAKRMSRSERLQRRVIVMWLRTLDELSACQERGDDPPVE